jgi:hypothetical protein
MNKLMTALLGLSLLTGAVVVAQDKGEDKKEKKAKKKGAKKEDKKEGAH